MKTHRQRIKIRKNKKRREKARIAARLERRQSRQDVQREKDTAPRQIGVVHRGRVAFVSSQEAPSLFGSPYCGCRHGQARIEAKKRKWWDEHKARRP